MNRNDKKIPEIIQIRNKEIDIMIKKYKELCRELDDADEDIQDENKDSFLSPMMYAFTCGEVAILEAVLHGLMGVLDDEELHQSKIFKEVK